MIIQIFFLFIYLSTALISYIYFSENFKLTKKPYISILISAFFSIVQFAANYFDNNNFVINCIVFFVSCIIYSKISFKISIRNSIFHSSLLLAIALSTEIVFQTGESFLFNIPIDAYKNNIAVLIITGIICKLLYLIVCKLLCTLFSYKKNNTPNDIKKTFILFLYPVMSTAVLAVFLYASAKYDFSYNLNLAGTLISIVSIILCCFIFIFNQSVQKQETQLIELQAENQKKEINQSFYELMDKKNEEQYVLIHDMKHHFSSLENMDTIEEIKKYLSTVNPEMIQYKYIGNSKNKMLDLVLNKYYHMCNINNIEFVADVKSCNLSFLNNTDLTSLVGNLLDNAVEAAKGVKNAKIRFTAKSEGAFYVLTIVNSSSHPPKAQGERLFTTKQDTLFHGYGVKSVERTAKKYDGVCEWHYEASDKTFHFNIIFNKNKGI